jgi:hypothetical protein
MSAQEDLVNDNPSIEALDKDLNPLTVGDQVSFIMAGFFRDREQECFGKIISIDQWGGISIQVVGTYRHFTSQGQIGLTSSYVYFVHHRYDSKLRARIYEATNNGHTLYIAKLEE